MEGVLFKKGDWVWSRRYFTERQNFVCYFADQATAEARSLSPRLLKKYKISILLLTVSFIRVNYLTVALFQTNPESPQGRINVAHITDVEVPDYDFRLFIIVVFYASLCAFISPQVITLVATASSASRSRRATPIRRKRS